MSIPRKDDGTLDERLISKIYIVCDPHGEPIFIVAITASGPKTEPASTPLVNEVKSSNIPYEESNIDEYVFYYHLQENTQELKESNKLKR